MWVWNEWWFTYKLWRTCIVKLIEAYRINFTVHTMPAILSNSFWRAVGFSGLKCEKMNKTLLWLFWFAPTDTDIAEGNGAMSPWTGQVDNKCCILKVAKSMFLELSLTSVNPKSKLHWPSSQIEASKCSNKSTCFPLVGIEQKVGSPPHFFWDNRWAIFLFCLAAFLLCACIPSGVRSSYIANSVS